MHCFRRQSFIAVTPSTRADRTGTASLLAGASCVAQMQRLLRTLSPKSSSANELSRVMSPFTMIAERK
jgi:hypothetical protein